MKYIVANWKAYVTSHKEAKDLFLITETVSNASLAKVIVCPPAVFLPDTKLDWDISLGLQNIFWEDKGAYTGEITISMLKDLNVEYVIIGHSERREYFGESDEDINKKVKAVLKAGLKVILCVGEKSRESDGSIPSVVADQVKKDLEGVSKNKLKDVMVAYEPIWAIGSGVSDTPEGAYQAALYIRKTVADIYGQKVGSKISVLYGGSVDSKNIRDFIFHHGIDGVLVGSASVKKSEFEKMMMLVN